MVYNPLDLLVNDLIELTFDDEAGMYDVDQIIAYTTKRNGSTLQATRYFLQDVETEGENDPLVLEVAEPEQRGGAVSFLFAITEAFEHDDEFVSLLDDDIFIISEEHEDQEEEEELKYIKISHVTSGTVTIDENNETNSGTFEVWTYQREEDGDTWYLVIEIDADDGWTTFYEGYELAEGEWQVSRLSGDL
jgi:hypothetical protein